MIWLDARDWLSVYFMVIAAFAAAGAAYVLAVWWAMGSLRGLRGLALAVALICVSLIATCFAGLHASTWRSSLFWLLIIERSAWWPLLLSLIVLVDLYAADHGDHRALTTILYRRWEQWRARKG